MAHSRENLTKAEAQQSPAENWLQKLKKRIETTFTPTAKGSAEKTKNLLSRRDFLKFGVTAGVGLFMMSSSLFFDVLTVLSKQNQDDEFLMDDEEESVLVDRLIVEFDQTFAGLLKIGTQRDFRSLPENLYLGYAEAIEKPTLFSLVSLWYIAAETFSKANVLPVISMDDDNQAQLVFFYEDDYLTPVQGACSCSSSDSIESLLINQSAAEPFITHFIMHELSHLLHFSLVDNETINTSSHPAIDWLQEPMPDTFKTIARMRNHQIEEWLLRFLVISIEGTPYRQASGTAGLAAYLIPREEARPGLFNSSYGQSDSLERYLNLIVSTDLSDSSLANLWYMATNNYEFVAELVPLLQTKGIEGLRQTFGLGLESQVSTMIVKMLTPDLNGKITYYGYNVVSELELYAQGVDLVSYYQGNDRFQLTEERDFDMPIAAQRFDPVAYFIHQKLREEAITTLEGLALDESGTSPVLEEIAREAVSYILREVARFIYLLIFQVTPDQLAELEASDFKFFELPLTTMTFQPNEEILISYAFDLPREELLQRMLEAIGQS